MDIDPVPREPSETASGMVDTRDIESLPSASKDDDLLSDLLVDRILFANLGKGTRKINADYEPPIVDMEAIKAILRRLNKRKNTRESQAKKALNRALRSFRELPIYATHTEKMDNKAKQAFESHLKRYLQVYLPDTGFDLCTTSRYASISAFTETDNTDASGSRSPISSGISERSALGESVASTASSTPALEMASKPNSNVLSLPPGKQAGLASEGASRSPTPSTSGAATQQDKALSELPVLDLALRATRNYKRGDIIPFLKGSLADLTPEQDQDLREMRNGMQSDFSVLMNEQRRVFQLFLGPARFCNHDCENNVEMFRDGKNILFRVVRDIHKSEEICSFYGEDYFDDRNASCMCVGCELLGKGAFSGAQPRVKAPGRFERRPKSARLERPPATHLGPRAMWNDRGEPEDSEDENLGRRQYASDSDSPDEGTGAPNQGGTIGFASKNTASKGNKVRWSWIPEGFSYDMFQTAAVDPFQPRMTRGGARAQGASANKTAMQLLKEQAPVFTYSEWENLEEQKAIQQAAFRRYDGDANDLLEDTASGDQINAQFVLPKAPLRRPKHWIAIPAAFAPEHGVSRRRAKPVLPEGADPSDYNLNKEEDELTYVQVGKWSSDLEGGWKPKWIKGRRRAAWEVEVEKCKREGLPLPFATSKKKKKQHRPRRDTDEKCDSRTKVATKRKFSEVQDRPEPARKSKRTSLTATAAPLVSLGRSDGIDIEKRPLAAGKDPNDYDLVYEEDTWQWFQVPSRLSRSKKVWDCRLLWGWKRAEAEMAVQDGKASQSILDNWPVPSKEDEMKPYRNQKKWPLLDDELAALAGGCLSAIKNSLSLDAEKLQQDQEEESQQPEAQQDADVTLTQSPLEPSSPKPTKEAFRLLEQPLQSHKDHLMAPNLKAYGHVEPVCIPSSQTSSVISSSPPSSDAGKTPPKVPLKTSAVFLDPTDGNADESDKLDSPISSKVSIVLPNLRQRPRRSKAERR